MITRHQLRRIIVQEARRLSERGEVHEDFAGFADRTTEYEGLVVAFKDDAMDASGESFDEIVYQLRRDI